jgi:ATP-dependent RNA helicase DeaD
LFLKLLNEERMIKANVDTPIETIDETAEITFMDLDLSRDLQQAIMMSGYEKPTAIQAEIIPHMLAGRDVIGQAQTGTGKTAAFALPILSRLQKGKDHPQVLVLAPTRELATQVAKSFETYGSCMPDFRVAAIFGGQDYEIQFKLLRRGVQVVVGTPGRVIDHIKRGTLKLDDISCLVLDEADEMLNMGFLEDVEFILEQAPQKKQIALFSATMPDPIRRIADKHLTDPAQITIRRKTMTAESIQQRCVFVSERDKLDLLSRMLEAEQTDGVIVFTKTKDSTIAVAEHLVQLGFAAAALNGDLPQKQRQRTVDQLKAGRLNVLVATDVAARGLDVQRISHVFNYDLPHDSESYIHRIGRTGRAGRSGVAIIFLTPPQRSKLRLIERATKQAIEVVNRPSINEINANRIQRFKTQIVETISAQDLGQFKKIVAEVAQESGKSLDDIAAAIAHIAQGSRPFMLKEEPRRESPGWDRDDRRSGRSFDDRRGPDERRGAGRQRYDEESRGGKRRRVGGPPAPGMLRYRIEVGHVDGVRPGNIVGAIANEGGISGSDIGPIEIHNSYSTIDLPDTMSASAVQTLRKTWVSGKQLRLRPFGSEDQPVTVRGGGGAGGKKPKRPAKNRS